MRSRGGSGVMAGGEGMTPNLATDQPRHAELVSASIVPHARVLRNETASPACPSRASAQTDGWTLKRVQGDVELVVVG